MKLVKSLLLGSAAGLAAAAGVQAADLPVKKAAAVEYVRVCSTYGAGFFYIPGTESCLRIGGRVRADYLYSQPFNRAQDALGFRVRGRVQLDHRTETAYGLLRSFIRFEITRNSGTGFVANGQIATTPDVAEAFIQFGGLTAGRTISFFDNPDLPTEHFGTLRFSDAPDVSVLAYTYSFGNGFSATLSIEDGLERRVNSVPFGLNLIPVDSPVPLFAPFGYTIGGQRMPDVVANVRYSGTWGSAQLAGAVHQIRDTGGAGLLNPITGTALPDFADTDYGFAVGAQAGINLPFLGAGDTAWLALTYTDGATGYILGGTGESFGAGDLSLPITDAYIDPFTGDFKETKAWSVAGGFTHNWTPEFRTSLFGSYARFDVPGSAGFVVPATPISIAAGTVGTRVGFLDFDELRLGGNAIWSPISGLNLGVEAIYVKLDPRGRVFIPVTNVAGTVIGGRPSGGEDIWEGRLRVQRDF